MRYGSCRCRSIFQPPYRRLRLRPSPAELREARPASSQRPAVTSGLSAPGGREHATRHATPRHATVEELRRRNGSWAWSNPGVLPCQAEQPPTPASHHGEAIHQGTKAPSRQATHTKDLVRGAHGFRLSVPSSHARSNRSLLKPL